MTTEIDAEISWALQNGQAEPQEPVNDKLLAC
jgi:hypothetical protein